MKAIVYHGNKDIRYHENYPDPQIERSQDVKIKVHYCGICGSDLKEYTDGPIFFSNPDETNKISGKPAPQCMGHEMSGEIVEIGADVVNVSVGDKVVVEVTGSCLDQYRFPDSPNFKSEKCGACVEGHYNACDHLGLIGLGFSDGGFSEYVVTDSSKAIKFSDDIIPMDVAALTQPIAVSWHAVRMSGFKEGSSALIIGGGPIGLATIFALKGHKAGTIVVSEPALARRLLAEKFNVKVFDPAGKSVQECVSELRKLSPTGFGFNYSYDCSGFPDTFNVNLKALCVRGVATNVAVWANKPIPYYPMDVTFSEKIVTGSICFVKQDFEEVVEALENGLIPIHEAKMLITSVIHLEDGIEKGFFELLNHKERQIKVLFSPKDEHRSDS
jgi:Threonine dehydrogenase and related Zn-dependent dehydrogenases